MKFPESMTYKEVQTTIMVRNPGGRIVIVRAEESGYKKSQIIDSSIFPQEIHGRFICLTKDNLGDIHPVYLLEVSNEEIFLHGCIACLCGPKTLNNICEELLLQEGIIEARSIRSSDLPKFDYKADTKSKYWIASRENYLGYLAIPYVYDGYLEYNTYDETEKIELGIRPIVVLKSKIIDIGEDNELDYSWI